MRNVAPTRSLVRRANQLKTLAFVILAIGIFVTVVGVALNIVKLVSVTSPSYSVYGLIVNIIIVIGVGLVITAVIMFIRAFTWKTDNDLAKMTAAVLAPHLGDEYTLIRNVSKRQIGYVDAVLVGPPGALVFRILDDEGVFSNEGANWLQRKPNGEWVPARIDPTRECVVDIRKLREYLLPRVGEIPVFGLIVFVKDRARAELYAKDSVVPLAHLPLMMEVLRQNYFAASRLSPEQVTAVVQALYSG